MDSKMEKVRNFNLDCRPVEERKTVITVFCFALINREIVMLEFRRNRERLFISESLFKRNSTVISSDFWLLPFHS